jgi:DNA-binding MarR family transcriptional regulator
MTETQRAAEDAFQDLLLGLFQLHGHVLQAADAMSGEFSLSGARWQVLKVVSRQPMTVSQIARRLGLQRQSVQRTVDAVRAQGLVEVLPNVDHARAGLIDLSTEGRRVLAALHERQREWVTRCLRGVPRSELASLAGSLTNLADRFERSAPTNINAGSRPQTVRVRRKGASQ